MFDIIDNGKKIECEVLFPFSDDSNNIDYIVYTDGTKDSDDELEILAARYVIKDGKYYLDEIKNDFEWNLVDNMIEARFKEVGD